MKDLVVLLAAISFAAIANSGPVYPGPLQMIDCGQATMTKPGVGNAFQGVIANEDYAFTARVPSGLTGWGGVDREAPFHGFTIFLDSQMSACIYFELHTRVNEEDAPKLLHSEKKMRLGEARAWQSVLIGQVGNARLTNIRTSFTFKRRDRVDDGEVVLIAPASKLSEAKRTYAAFIRSLKFSQ
jgi:hypothetical protein